MSAEVRGVDDFNPSEILMQALEEVLSVTFFMSVSIESQDLSIVNECNEFVAMVPFRGAGQGLLALSASREFSQNMVSAVTGEQKSTNAELGDSIAELANMVAGLAKRDFARGNFAIDLGVPITLLHASSALVAYHGLPKCKFQAISNGARLNITAWLEPIA